MTASIPNCAWCGLLIVSTNVLYAMHPECYVECNNYPEDEDGNGCER